MERYELQLLYPTADDFKSALETSVTNMGLMFSSSYTNSVYSTFIAYSIYKYFYEDKVHYEGETTEDVKSILMKRLGYDIAVKFPYWKRKYDYIVDLLSDEELSLFQTSKMTSQSHEHVNSVGGVIQKSASTPTGVQQATEDAIDMSMTIGDDSLNVEVGSESFADKYTNYQGKTSSTNKNVGDRNGEVLREGSIEDVLNVLEKLPSSFADEITEEVSKHFELLYSY